MNKFLSTYNIVVDGRGVPSTSLSPATLFSGKPGADKKTVGDVILSTSSYYGSVSLTRTLPFAFMMSFADAYRNSYLEELEDNIIPKSNFSEEDIQYNFPSAQDGSESLDWEVFEHTQSDSSYRQNYDTKKLEVYDPHFRTSNGVGLRNLGISFDPSVMYIMGVTNSGHTYGGSSSGFMLGETFGAATGPSGLIVGIMDFTAATAGSSVGGVSGSMTGECFALFMAEVGPTSGFSAAGVTQFVVGSTGHGSSFGGTGEIEWIYDLNSLYIQGAKDSITKTINNILPHVPMGLTVGNGNTAHQIRVYDQDDKHIENIIKGIEEGQERSDLIRGFSSGYTSGYRFDPKSYSTYTYSNTVLLDPNTAITGSGSEAQELSYYLSAELDSKRTTFNSHVRSLMLANSEIDTLYKLSEYGIPETFRRLYEQ